jgi:hypothetical protein
MRTGVFFISALSIGVFALSGCAFLPPSHRQDFTVVGDVPGTSVSGANVSVTGAGFHNADPDIDAALAKRVCADGYDKLNEATLPSDGSGYDQWRLRCAGDHKFFGLF